MGESFKNSLAKRSGDSYEYSPTPGVWHKHYTNYKKKLLNHHTKYFPPPGGTLQSRHKFHHNRKLPRTMRCASVSFLCSCCTFSIIIFLLGPLESGVYWNRFEGRMYPAVRAAPFPPRSAETAEHLIPPLQARGGARTYREQQEGGSQKK